MSKGKDTLVHWFGVLIIASVGVSSVFLDTERFHDLSSVRLVVLRRLVNNYPSIMQMTHYLLRLESRNLISLESIGSSRNGQDIYVVKIQVVPRVGVGSGASRSVSLCTEEGWEIAERNPD